MQISTETLDRGAYDILLRPGWSTNEDGLHTIIEPTIARALQELRCVGPCACSECTAELEPTATVEKTARGGTREGAGRPKLDPEGTIVTTVRLTGEQRATFEMLGGGKWLRDHLQGVIDSGHGSYYKRR